MYNREKIMQTLRDICDEAKDIKPYVVIAQPRRNKIETAAQKFNGYGLHHVNLMGGSYAYVDCEGMLVDVARNYLIEQVIEESGAKYMFFIGDDTVVPYDAFQVLHKTAEENPDAVVTGVYYIKCSHAMISVKKNDQIIVPNVDPGQLFEAWQTGMDCMLIPVSLLKKMKEEEPELPFCCIANGIEDIPFIGEDNFFVHRLRRHGIRLLVNTDVQCLHMDLSTGKYTAHPDVNLNNYYTNIKPTGVLTIDDKKFLDERWYSRLPGSKNSPYEYDKWLPGQDIPKIISEIENPVGIEIGVEKGITTEHLLKNVNGLTLFGIDPYTEYTDWDGAVSPVDTNKQEALERTKTYDNFELIQKTSDDAAELFEDGSMDFIFVDGLHTYEQVLKDCQNYWPKLKSGGYLIGHDYTKIQDVNRAATEFIKSVGKEVETAKQDLWYIIKD
jgi:hypothetical protein